ncbi:hypothetical protein G0Q06_01480 [Puniceicoccales bacterium CK1056]|uniref:Glycosyl hydrolase family 28 n=1 Tax=Oceanipulchritudo coccoides TaxID=2706888 RepID=A0A6B2LYV4_9BACT|nr:glycosyl hydrolase family 28 protein [Oceanipulchritudo coccoides]NDV61114.1 hypothetical protein [Oceanipulchritudo coccoides]
MLKRSIPHFGCFLAILYTLVSAVFVSAQSYTVYPQPAGISPSDKYQVELSADGQNWTHSFTYMTTAKDNSDPDLQGYYLSLAGWTASYTNFEFSGTIQIRVTKLTGPISSAIVRPTAYNIPVTINNNTATFSLSKPANLAIEIDGKPNANPFDHSLSIFANSYEQDVPVENDPNVLVVNPGDLIPAATGSETWTTLHFKPGVHNLGPGYQIASNKRYYLEGGSFVYGGMVVLDTNYATQTVDNVKIWGYGVLSGEQVNWPPKEWPQAQRNWYRMINIQGLNSNIVLEGLTIVDPPFHSVSMGNINGATTPNIIRNIKTQNWRNNSDGIGVQKYAIVEDCFLRTQDDSIYIANGQQDVVIRNITTWNDANGSSFIFTAGAGGSGTSVSDSSVIYNHRAELLGGQGGSVFNLRGINTGETVENIYISNIHVEDPNYGLSNNGTRYRPIFFMQMTNSNAVFRNVKFSNIIVDAPMAPESLDNLLTGLNSTDSFMEDISFTNLYIDGTPVKSAAEGRFTVNHVQGLSFQHYSFFDDFDHRTSIGWIALSGGGQTVADGLDYALETEGLSNMNRLYAEETWGSDYSVVSTVRVDTWDPATLPGKAQAGLLGRLTDVDNHYAFFYDDYLKKFRIIMRAGTGNPITVLANSASSYTLNPGQEYQLEFRLNGSALEGFLDGVLVTAATDSTLTQGYTGVFSGAPQMAIFDDFITDNSSAPPPPADDLSDDFSDGISDGWTEAEGNWAVVADGVDYTYETSAGNSSDLSFNTASDHTNVEVSAELKVDSWSKKNKPGEVQVGIVARYQDASNYYAFIFDKSSATYQLIKIVGDNASIIAQSGSTPLPSTGIYNEYRFELNGTSLLGLVDGLEVISGSDSSLSSGKAGFYTSKSQEAKFDNFVMNNL